MTARTESGMASDEMEADSGVELTRDDVARYLREHRDFFVHFPGLVETLDIPHETGEAVSLVERQIAMLRDRNSELDSRLRQLIAVAGENEKASLRLHNLALKVMPIQGFDESLAGVREQLLADFPGTEVRLRLLGMLPSSSVSGCASMDETLLRSKLIQDLFSDKHRGVVFLGERQIEAVFEPEQGSQPVSSAVSVALKDFRHLGALFLGSTDASRFRSGTGTLFLENLGEIVSTKLQQFATG